MSMHSLRLAAFASLLAGSAFAQVTTPEVEPNETKLQATANGAITMVANDKLTGTTTGTSTTVAGAASADTFRVRTGVLPAGIYRHTLSITTTGTAGHSGSIRGLNQTSAVGQPGIIGTTDSAFQSSTTTAPEPRANTWYGFGRSEEIYYRVTGTASTTGAYEATLTTTPVAPTVVPGTFLPGAIVMTTVGQTTTDTDIHLFDGTLTAIDDASNDDNSVAEGGPGTGLQSQMTRTLAAGTYYLAVSSYNTGTNDNSPASDNFRTGLVLDFPDAVANSSTTATAQDFDVAITDTAGTVNVVNLGPAARFAVTFVQFTVGNAIPAPVAYCFGDGSGTACPCGNSGAAGNGCASSVNPAGANLGSTGTASVGADTLVLQGSGMPNSSALYFQGTTQISTVFGDGLRCAGGSVIRLSTKTNAGGSSSYPQGGDLAVSVKGNCVAGDIRTYQIWYRNAAAFCTADTFNLSNGLQVTWGA